MTTPCRLFLQPYLQYPVSHTPRPPTLSSIRYHAATDIAVQAAAASPFPANMPLDESYISSFSAPQDRSLPGSPLRHLSPPRDGPDGVRSSGSSSVYMSPERVRDSPGRMSALPQVLSPGRVRPGYMVPSPPRMRYARSVGVRSHHSSPPRPGSVSPPMVVGGSAPMAGGGDPNGAISWDEHHDYLLEHFGVRCVTVPVVGTKGNVVAVLQVARRGGAEFAPSEVRQVEAVAQLVGLSLHRLSSAAVQRAARKQATSALEDAQKKLSTSAKKVRRCCMSTHTHHATRGEVFWQTPVLSGWSALAHARRIFVRDIDPPPCSCAPLATRMRL